MRPLDSVVNVVVSPGALHDRLADALQAATSVHQVRDSAEVVVVGSHPRMTQLGAYVHEKGGKPVAILVNEQASDPGLTFLHEVGHYVDQHAIDTPGYASVSQELDDWRSAALASSGVADLIATWVSPPMPSNPAHAAAVAAGVRAHVEYLLGTRELFARSYCQYVAVRSGSAQLLEELEKSLQANYREQWYEEDFAPIADALDSVFDQLGWR